jgi:protein TonB
VYEAVDEQPEPPGGIGAFTKYLAEHIRYPEQAKEAGVQGKVYVSMVVGKDGRLSNVQVKKDNLGYGCGEEAVRVIKSMPPWKPGKMNGNAVTVKYTIPVTFVLR